MGHHVLFHILMFGTPMVSSVASPAQVVITDGALPEVARAALRADGLSIIEAKDELQALVEGFGAVRSIVMCRVC